MSVRVARSERQPSAGRSAGDLDTGDRGFNAQVLRPEVDRDGVPGRGRVGDGNGDTVGLALNQNGGRPIDAQTRQVMAPGRERVRTGQLQAEMLNRLQS